MITVNCRTGMNWLLLKFTFVLVLLVFIFGRVGLADWQIETVDSAEGVGAYNSIALDSSDSPHISYYDASLPNQKVKYAWKDDTGWHTTAVPYQEGDYHQVGVWTSLALDSSDYPHISYCDYGHQEIEYAWQDGTGWHITTVDDSGDHRWRSSITLDSFDYPHISYFETYEDDLYYSWKNLTDWHTLILDSGGAHNSIAVDSFNHPHISYDSYPEYNLKYTWRDDTGWHTTTVDFISVVGHLSLALDSSDYPHIAYIDDIGDNFKYAWQDSSGWHTANVDGNTGSSISIALDSSDNPHISYVEHINGDRNLRYAWKDDTGWHTTTVDDSGDIGVHNSIAIDSSNHPHISYSGMNGSELRYAFYRPLTLMVYLAADNNLGGGTPGAPDFMDFDEMESALTTSWPDLNIVVLWDKPGVNDTEIYLVQPDSIEGTLATYTLGLNKWTPPWGTELNMGDRTTLTNFINWVHSNFTSGHYGLILWNHGGGWEPKTKSPLVQHQFLLENGETWEQTFWPPSYPVKEKDPGEKDLARQDPISKGICWDDTDGSYLTTKEVANGIANSNIGWVDNLGFDACLMQMLEVAYEVRDLAFYLTASQESEWGCGWAYHEILSGITFTTTPLDLAQAWGSTRLRWHSGGLDTISSLDLTKVDDLAADVSALADRLDTLLGTNACYQDIMYAKLLSLCFGYNEYLDLGDFCHWIKVFIGDTTAANLAQAVQDEIANTVVAKANGSGYSSASGISIYMPHQHDIPRYYSGGSVPHSNYTGTNFAFCNDHSWDDFINNCLSTDYGDPHESNDTPAAAYNRGTLNPNLIYLCQETDFDDSTADWYKFSVPFPSDMTIWAWCTEYYSDTVIYLYDSLTNANADNYFASNNDGLYNSLGRNQRGSYLHSTGLSSGTYYVKVVPWGSYGTEMDYEVWLSASRTPTPAVFRVELPGHLVSDGPVCATSFQTGAADVAEWVSVSEPVESGDVLELDRDNPGHYRKSRGPCSTLVAGVVSTDPGFVLGAEDLDSSSGLSIDNSRLTKADSALLALVGIVPVKATTENGPIKLGSLLTTSSKPGYAMACNDMDKCAGALIGKALEPLEDGNGVIQMLVMY